MIFRFLRIYFGGDYSKAMGLKHSESASIHFTERCLSPLIGVIML
jgi:hypothetical protein